MRNTLQRRQFVFRQYNLSNHKPNADDDLNLVLLDHLCCGIDVVLRHQGDFGPAKSAGDKTGLDARRVKSGMRRMVDACSSSGLRCGRGESTTYVGAGDVVSRIGTRREELAVGGGDTFGLARGARGVEHRRHVFGRDLDLGDRIAPRSDRGVLGVELGGVEYLLSASTLSPLPLALREDARDSTWEDSYAAQPAVCTGRTAKVINAVLARLGEEFWM